VILSQGITEWYVSIIPELCRWMQEDGEFETSLDYISKTLSQTSPQKQKQTKNTCLSAGDVKSDDLVVQIFLLL
jgi:hypothetical protein